MPTTQSSALNVKDVSQQLKDFQKADSTRQQLVEGLLQELSEARRALEAAKSDLEDQTALRRSWKKRAEIAELSLVRNQFVLALVDGDRYIFTDKYLKDTQNGAAAAARDLALQIKSYLHERNLQSGPPEIAVMVHIFVNKQALSKALVDSGTLSEVEELDTFMWLFMSAQPHFYFVDCGPAEGAVDAMIKLSYEFNFDNAHCKHLLLALRHESGYIVELDTYREDESTLAKTSLLRSSHSVTGKFANMFPIADAPSLRTIALISLDSIDAATVDAVNKKLAGPSDRASGATDELRELFESKSHVSQTSEHTTSSQAVVTDHSAGPHDSSTASSFGHVPLEKTEPASTSLPVEEDKRGTEPAELTEPPKLAQLPYEAEKPKIVRTPSVPQDRTHPFQNHVNSYVNEWESAPAQSEYMPPPDTRPWGSEDVAPSGKLPGPTPSQSWAEDASVDNTSTAATVSQSWQAEADVGNKFQWYNGGNQALHSPPAPHSPARSRRRVEEAPEFVAGRTLSGDLHKSRYSSGNGISPTHVAPDSKPAVAVNRQGQRIDIPLPTPPRSDQAKFDARTSSRKRLCTEHHLRRKCNNKACGYEHGTVGAGELQALRIAARHLPCSVGTGCRRPDCSCGHHCPYKQSPGGCTRQDCRFIGRGLHKVDDLQIESYIQP